MPEIGRFLGNPVDTEAAGADLRPDEPLPQPIPFPETIPARPTERLTLSSVLQVLGLIGGRSTTRWGS